MSPPVIATRSAPAATVQQLVADGVHPLLARLYAARGVTRVRDVASDFGQLAGMDTMLNLRTMARLLAEAVLAGKRLLIVADYDADGATACAVGLRALRTLERTRATWPRTASSTATV